MYTFEWDFYERREAAAREEELLALETRERDDTWVRRVFIERH